MPNFGPPMGSATITRRINELKRTALSLMSEEQGDLPEKIIDSMIDIVYAKEEEEKRKRKRQLQKRLKEMISRAEEDIHKRYSAKVDTLEIIKIHMKKEEIEEASTLLRGFYLTRKLRRRRARPQPKPEGPPAGAETDAVREVLDEESPSGILLELAELMSISEEEARMYSLELASGFAKATKHEITPEKAAECYLKFRNWDFKRTWLPVISENANVQ
jgi:hypothetical protein